MIVYKTKKLLKNKIVIFIHSFFFNIIYYFFRERERERVMESPNLPSFL